MSGNLSQDLGKRSGAMAAAAASWASKAAGAAASVAAISTSRIGIAWRRAGRSTVGSLPACGCGGNSDGLWQQGWRHQSRGWRVGPCRGLGSVAPGWSEKESPYDVLGVGRNADEEGIKSAYRRLAKQYHPDVYSGDEGLPEGETVESKFIKIQAAYELLMDSEARRRYDIDNRSNPMKASKSWMEWLLKKKQSYEQRGDMAVTLWAQQQQREMNLKARQLSRLKMDPEEERRIIAKEKQASMTNFQTTLKRHTLVLKKRDIVRKRAEEEAKNKLVQKLLASEGLELDDDRYQND